jgi:hypothetical protein
MSFRETDFAGQVALLYSNTGPTSAFGGSPVTGIHKFNTNAAAEIAAIVTALGSDATAHDQTIEARSAALTVGEPNGLVAPAAGWKSRLGNDLILLINAAKGGGLSNSQIISGIDDAVGVAHAPAVIDIPYASANAKPPIVGTVCSCTTGNWTGSPTAYAYQWTRDGTNIASATAATYTLVAADVGGHQIRCLVTATNATGSTAAPPSNFIST